MIDMKEIRNLYKMFEGDEIDELEIQTGDTRIKLNLGQAAVVSAPAAPAKKDRKDAPSAAPAVVETAAAIPAAEAPAPAEKITELRSNWVGFFTRVNPKTSENYVKLRDMVKKGSVIGHVRVLGVLQDLKSDVDGKVKEILIEEGQPIEYGQPVMRFEVE